MIKRAPRRHIKLAVILLFLLGSRFTVAATTRISLFAGAASSIFLLILRAFLASPNNVIVHYRGTIEEEQKQISIIPIAMNSDEPVFFSEAGKRKGVKDVPHKSLEGAISLRLHEVSREEYTQFLEHVIQVLLKRKNNINE